jgi:hypothetical protein
VARHREPRLDDLAVGLRRESARLAQKERPQRDVCTRAHTDKVSGLWSVCCISVCLFSLRFSASKRLKTICERLPFRPAYVRKQHEQEREPDGRRDAGRYSEGEEVVGVKGHVLPRRRGET